MFNSNPLMEAKVWLLKYLIFSNTYTYMCVCVCITSSFKDVRNINFQVMLGICKRIARR